MVASEQFIASTRPVADRHYQVVCTVLVVHSITVEGEVRLERRSPAHPRGAA